MKWFGISGSRLSTNEHIEKDVREFVREVINRGDGIVTGGALGVDYFATDEVLKLNPEANHIKVYIPATLEAYSAHYRRRAQDKVITEEEAETLIKQLNKLVQLNPTALLEDESGAPVDSASYAKRNGSVVAASDELAAFQVNDSSGTQNTIDQALAKGIPVILKKYTNNIIE
jgi:uncharacterized phage-like protein YoqJ